MRQLQWRKGVVALANTHRNGFACIPLLLINSLVSIALPFCRWQYTAFFAIQIDAGQLTKTKGLHEIMDRINTKIIGQNVVVSITGHDDGFVHINPAMPTFFIVAEFVISEHKIAGVINGHLRGAFAQLKSSQRHVWFEGRAGRVGTNQRAIQQGAIDRGIQFVPAFDINPFDEQVWIKGWHRHIGEYVAGGRLNRH